MWGSHRQAVMLRAHPKLSWALCWTTMLGECSVPLALVVPLPVGLFILACAAVFHVVSAFTMRLNPFFWAFVSTFPAIIFCSDWLHGVHP
jgi:hypothetical protein